MGFNRRAKARLQSLIRWWMQVGHVVAQRCGDVENIKILTDRKHPRRVRWILMDIVVCYCAVNVK